MGRRDGRSGARVARCLVRGREARWMRELSRGLAVHLVIAERIRQVASRRPGCGVMAGRKRRKRDGVAGFIAGAIGERQKAQAQAQRLEARAQ
jgi:hypothetical protein